MQELACKDQDIRRIHERKKYRAEIVFIHSDHLYSGSMENISLGGAYIETHCVNQFFLEDIVTMNIPFPSGTNYVKRKGRIKWSNSAGFAIEFI